MRLLSVVLALINKSIRSVTKMFKFTTVFVQGTVHFQSAVSRIPDAGIPF